MKTLAKVFVCMMVAVGVIACTKAEEAIPGLEGTSWLMVDVRGLPVVEESLASIRFSDDNSVIGFTGCNRFTGTAQIIDAKITFSPMKATRRGCARPLLEQERAIFEALRRVNRFTISELEMLVLLDDQETPVMSLKPVAPKPEEE